MRSPPERHGGRAERKESLQLVVAPGGVVRCLYGELIDLAVLGRCGIRRASHVEPDAAGLWWADLGPVRGPRLGPYRRRTEALAAERAWLEDHWLRGDSTDPAPGPRPPLTPRRSNPRDSV